MPPFASNLLIVVVLLCSSASAWHEDDLFPAEEESSSPSHTGARSLLSEWAQPAAAYPSGGAPLTFVAFGDWGCGPSNCHLPNDEGHSPASVNANLVAQEMAKAAGETDAKFVVALGDNFYWRGVSSENDPLFKTVFEDRFKQPELQVPWFVILGNHDHYGNADAQLLYSQSGRDKRWVLPNYFWSTEQHVEGGRVLQLVMIDTVLLDEEISRAGLLEKIESGHVPQESLAMWDARSAQRMRAGQEQLLWLEGVLYSSKADWLVVCGHYPIFSGGEHGSTPSLVSRVKPLLERYGVDAYLSGHDHTLQHLSEGGVEYYVSGNGALNGEVEALPETMFAAVDPGFSVHQVSGDVMKTTFVDHKGTPLYSHVARRKRNL